MVSMLIARPLSAVGGLLVLVILSRMLPAQDYGIYFGLWAISEILILASNVGLIHAVYRYVSADELLNGKIIPRGPVWKLIGWRMLSLACVATLLLAFPTFFQSFSKSSTLISNNIIPLLALIVFGEGLARFVESIFDSMLCQGRSQTTLISRTLLRLIGIAYFVMNGNLHLEQVVWIEVGATLIGSAIALLLLLYTYSGTQELLKHENKEVIGFGRMARFALPAFIAQIFGLVYGPDALKLALSSTSGPVVLASFGFAYSLTAVVQRYIPANLLAGIFRPVFVAAAKKPNADELLSNLLITSVKINWLIILPVFCFLYFGGSPLLSKLSGGNYPDAGLLISILMLGLLAIAVHLTISMYCLAKETSNPVLIASGISTIGLPIGILLAHHYGAQGMALTFGLSELIWSMVCLIVLTRYTNQALHLNLSSLGKLLGAVAISITACTLLQLMNITWFVLAPLSAVIFFLGIWLMSPFSDQEKGWLLSILPMNYSFKTRG
jgi:O-antigen/teichoic acid export membrane protein